MPSVWLYKCIAHAQAQTYTGQNYMTKVDCMKQPINILYDMDEIRSQIMRPLAEPTRWFQTIFIVCIEICRNSIAYLYRL